VHGDLHVGNILVSPGQARITGVIDFDLAHQADPLVDLAFSMWWWCRPAVQEHFWDAAAGTLIGYCRRRALPSDASSWLVTLLKARGLMLLVRLRDYHQACDEIHETLRFVVEHDEELASFARDALAGAN
jgi:aminoglycoside phosphotransferase (APT) family kinase protein